ncbi:hypothetical protein BWD14_06135 [Leptospira santarosai]|uniref:Uncharacterized protein n=1 Tax=Leptospira santarosai TaxID=28183 RepID=A0AB73LUU5_9LEPT|nr:hypothetical protein BWD14_06135 [Leptospira santarosai]
MNQGNKIPDRSCVHSKFTINRLQSFGKNAGVPTNYVSLGFVRDFRAIISLFNSRGSSHNFKFWNVFRPKSKIDRKRSRIFIF